MTGLTTAIVEHPEQYVSNENENILADGCRVWMQWTNKSILDEAGNIREILAIGNDITERKRAEEELRLAHLRCRGWRASPRKTRTPCCACPPGGSPVLQPGGDGAGRVEMRIGRPTPDPVLPLVRKAMAEDREVMQDVDLGERTYSVAVTSFPAEGYANVYGRDITERKRAEEALQQSRERLDLALSSSRMATFEWDIVENKRTWSASVFMSLLGTKPETFTGDSRRVFPDHPSGRSKYRASGPCQGRRNEPGCTRRNIDAVWPDGSIHYIAARVKQSIDRLTGRAAS